MNIRKHNQSGFSTIELLFVILILVLIGFAGSWVYRDHHKTSSPPTSAPATTTTDSIYTVNGPSMTPTLTSGQTVLIQLKNTNIQINNIVVFNITSSAVGPTSEQLIKRVVAVAGDKVVISNNTLTVYDSAHPNGYNPSSSYEPASSATSITTGNINLTVPAGDVFVLGDNRPDSLDSRLFGVIPTSSIVGVEVKVAS